MEQSILELHKELLGLRTSTSVDMSCPFRAWQERYFDWALPPTLQVLVFGGGTPWSRDRAGALLSWELSAAAGRVQVVAALICFP